MIMGNVMIRKTKSLDIVPALVSERGGFHINQNFHPLWYEHNIMNPRHEAILKTSRLFTEES